MIFVVTATAFRPALRTDQLVVTVLAGFVTWAFSAHAVERCIADRLAALTIFIGFLKFSTC